MGLIDLPRILECVRGGGGLCDSTPPAPDLLLRTLWVWGPPHTQRSTLSTSGAWWTSVVRMKSKPDISIHSPNMYLAIEWGATLGTD